MIPCHVLRFLLHLNQCDTPFFLFSLSYLAGNLFLFFDMDVCFRGP